MKKIIFVLTLLLVGCGSSDDAKVANKTADIPNHQPEMQQASSLLISHFMKSLKSELMKGVKEGGFEEAIGSCQLKAPEITGKFSSDNWSIRRVTDKPRNQLNKVDAHELEIMAKFTDTLNKIEFFDEWKNAEDSTSYYFYKPIYIGKFCLKCHGDVNSIDEKAAIALKEKYPEDNALNYATSDIRGMFIVHINSADNLELLMQNLQDSL